MGNVNGRDNDDDEDVRGGDGRIIPEGSSLRSHHPVPGHVQTHHIDPMRGGTAMVGDGQESGDGRLGHAGSSESIEHLSDSPGSTARSPLMFTPQIPTNPIHKADEFAMGPFHSGMYESHPYDDNGPEKGIPTMIVWSHGGNSVFVEGSWDNWSTRQPLQKSGKDFTILKILPSSVYQYKYLVDGEWRYAPDLPSSKDETGNINNVLDVQDYVPENLDNVVGFEPPLSPESSYDDAFPGPEDFAKEPPVLPPHLHLTLLNVPSVVETPGALPRPQHVILNHLYVEKGKSAKPVLALGSTHRFRSKYVTVVLYKPIHK